MIAKDLVAASAKPLILAILAEGESYGYEITRKVRDLSEGVLEWTDGMLYPVLHRLERQRLVVSEWKQSETGRERKYYRLSSTGEQSLKAERRQWLTVAQPTTAWCCSRLRNRSPQGRAELPK